MLIRKPGDIPPSEITPRGYYERRRELIKLAAAGSILGTAGLLLPGARAQTAGLQKLGNVSKSRYSTNEAQTAIYAAILAALLGYRVMALWKRRRRGAVPPGSKPARA